MRFLAVNQTLARLALSQSAVLSSRPQLRPADYQDASARQLLISNLPRKLQIEPEPRAFLAGRIVEKINHVATKPILQTAAFVEIEWTRRIHSYVARFVKGGAQFPLEPECSSAYLRHRERQHVI